MIGVLGTTGLATLLALVVVSVAGGVVVATLGPGGIFVIVGLYLLTSLSSAQIAGTSSATFTAGAVLGSAVYARSGEMRWRVAGVVGTASAAGTGVGVRTNAHLSRAAFGLALAALLAVVGIAIVYREYRDLEPVVRLEPDRQVHLAAFVAIGLAIGFFGGLLGIGGAALTVPALVVVGIPMLASVAVTQIIVVFVTLFTTVNYALLGTIAFPLVLATGGAYLLGVVLGWRIAHRIEAKRLKVALGVVLIGLAASLVV